MPGTDPTIYGVAPVSVKGFAVNKMGNRFNQGTAVNGPVGGFANETNASFCFNSTTLDWDSIPCWAIFDDTARKKGPIMSTTYTPSSAPGVTGASSWFVNYSGYKWSSDNSAEVASGWILSANSISALASAIAADPDNKGKMTGAQLQATLTAYNTDVANGVDAQLLTSGATLAAVNGSSVLCDEDLAHLDKRCVRSKTEHPMPSGESLTETDSTICTPPAKWAPSGDGSRAEIRTWLNACSPGASLATTLPTRTPGHRFDALEAPEQGASYPSLSARVSWIHHL